jgi:hypothetical protein
MHAQKNILKCIILINMKMTLSYIILENNKLNIQFNYFPKYFDGVWKIPTHNYKYLECLVHFFHKLLFPVSYNFFFQPDNNFTTLHKIAKKRKKRIKRHKLLKWHVHGLMVRCLVTKTRFITWSPFNHARSLY